MNLTITPEASKQIKAVIAEKQIPKAHLHPLVTWMQGTKIFSLSFTENVRDYDTKVVIDDIKVMVQKADERYFDGTILDYDTKRNGFTFTLPATLSTYASGAQGSDNYDFFSGC